MFSVQTGKSQAAYKPSILVVEYKTKLGLTCKFIDKLFQLLPKNVKTFEMSLIDDVTPRLCFLLLCNTVENWQE